MYGTILQNNISGIDNPPRLHQSHDVLGQQVARSAQKTASRFDKIDLINEDFDLVWESA